MVHTWWGCIHLFSAIICSSRKGKENTLNLRILFLPKIYCCIKWICHIFTVHFDQISANVIKIEQNFYTCYKCGCDKQNTTLWCCCCCCSSVLVGKSTARNTHNTFYLEFSSHSVVTHHKYVFNSEEGNFIETNIKNNYDRMCVSARVCVTFMMLLNFALTPRPLCLYVSGSIWLIDFWI